MRRRDFGWIIGSVVMGLGAGARALAEEAKSTAKGDKADQADKHVCKGKNDCKGQGADGKNACKGKGGCAAAAAKHDCRGKNDCKGLGGCKTAGNTCAGRNECKGKGGCAVPVKEKPPTRDKSGKS